jgi:hypothetical protein
VNPFADGGNRPGRNGRAEEGSAFHSTRHRIFCCDRLALQEPSQSVRRSGHWPESIGNLRLALQARASSRGKGRCNRTPLFACSRLSIRSSIYQGFFGSPLPPSPSPRPSPWRSFGAERQEGGTGAKPLLSSPSLGFLPTPVVLFLPKVFAAAGRRSCMARCI